MHEHAGYRSDIDGLRALAVLLVVGYHAAPGYLPGGFIGVDVFFVISGFLITGIIVRDHSAGRFSFQSFYARRCRRILPALCVVLAAALIIGWFTLLSAEFEQLGRDVVAGATFTTNLVVWRNFGYFADAAGYTPLLHLWSLGVEEQYYVLWPFLLVFMLRRKWPFFSCIAVAAFASFALKLALIGQHAVLSFYLLPTRFWELLMGGALVAPTVQRRLRVLTADRMRSDVAALLALAVLIIAALVLTPDNAYPGWRALAPAVAAAMLIAFGTASRISRIALSNRVAVGIGLISYPLYLWHWPLLSFAQIWQTGIVPHATRGVLVAVSFVLAWMTYRGLERPLRRRVAVDGVRNQSRQLFAVSALLIAIIAAAGWNVRVQQGFRERYPAQERLAASLSRREYFLLRGSYQQCSGALAAAKSFWRCEMSRAGEPAIALVGDSHADHLFPGIAAASGADWLLLSQPGCPPVQGVRVHPPGATDTCFDSNDLTGRLVTAMPSVKTVVLAFRGAAYTGVSRQMALEPANGTARADVDDLLAYGLDRELQLLEAAGRQVVIVLAVPDLEFDPAACVDLRSFRLVQQPRRNCVVSRSSAAAKQFRYRAIVSRLAAAHPEVRVYDLFPVLCDERWCYGSRGDELLYRDNNHLNISGSRLVAADFVRWLDRERIN